MTKQDIRILLADLRHVTIFPARCKTLLGKGSDYWLGVMRKYCNAEKRIDASAFRWFVLEFLDGHSELAYLRVLRDGLFSGKTPAIYRGLVIPRRVDFVAFSHICRIRQAF